MKHPARLIGLVWALAIVWIALRIYCPSLWTNPEKYTSLDPQAPFVFTGRQLIYGGDSLTLGPKAFLVDADLSERDARRFKYAFRSFNEAAACLQDGTPEEPMTVYLAPGVYWIDDPDDPAVRRPAEGGIPYGLVIPQSELRLVGLTARPENVVLACNRGQSQGAEGNFTMLRFLGDGIGCENITFGNYCNVDLVFPLQPGLNRAKRMEAITQAQLILCQSDRVYARNCSFISRLNACPFVGSKRALFDHCHFECTDDALCGSAVYLHCDLDFYSSKPFWSTHGTGAAFLDCDFTLHTAGTQYLTKVGSQVALVDCRFRHEGDIALAWTPYPRESQRSYQYNLTLNGQPVSFNAGPKAYLTVDMTGKDVLNAYRYEYQGQVVYNIYGLTRGDDGWDPYGQRALCEAASAEMGKDLASVPVMLRLKPASDQIETGVSETTVNASLYRFYDIPVQEPLVWRLNSRGTAIGSVMGDAAYRLVGNNYNEYPYDATVTASTASGLQGAAVVTVKPKTLAAPAFWYKPYVTQAGGRLRVRYQLDLGERADQSLVTWYRCDDAQGSHPVAVAVSRNQVPELYYTLQPGDVGHYLMAEVAPKHVRSQAGPAMSAIYAQPIDASMVTSQNLSTDFHNFPSVRQVEILPGPWTLDGYKPADTEGYDWKAPEGDTWFYGTAQDGAKGQGFLQKSKGARLMYTPVDTQRGNMAVTLLVDPCKTAGQGFGSATGQYLDLCLKFDTRTLTGYGLRIERTTKFANAVDFGLVKYENGRVTPLGQPVSASCFRTGCRIALQWENGRLTATAASPEIHPHDNPAVLTEVQLEAEAGEPGFDGFALQHTGSVGSSALMLHQLDIRWY